MLNALSKNCDNIQNLTINFTTDLKNKLFLFY